MTTELPAEQIIVNALEQYNPVKVLLLVSGGHDSVTSAHVSASVLESLRVEYSVYHGDTTIGIPATQEYVKMICEKYGWPLAIRKPPNEKDWYENIIREHGFPGPTRLAHQFMYRRLKERALRKYVTHDCKTSPRKRENVLLLTGVRQHESRIRMGYTLTTQKEGSKVWCNPIFYWSEDECKAYMRQNEIPRNPVKDRICISGECLCGAFAGKEEWAEIKFAFPEVAKEINRLHEIAKAAGKPWGWASGPVEWKIEQAAKSQLSLFMCVGCETRKDFV